MICSEIATQLSPTPLDPKPWSPSLAPVPLVTHSDPCLIATVTTSSREALPDLLLPQSFPRGPAASALSVGNSNLLPLGRKLVEDLRTHEKGVRRVRLLSNAPVLHIGVWPSGNPSGRSQCVGQLLTAPTGPEAQNPAFPPGNGSKSR